MNNSPNRLWWTLLTKVVICGLTASVVTCGLTASVAIGGLVASQARSQLLWDLQEKLSSATFEELKAALDQPWQAEGLIAARADKDVEVSRIAKDTSSK